MSRARGSDSKAHAGGSGPTSGAYFGSKALWDIFWVTLFVGWSEGPKQLNLESLRVHDRIKSKLRSNHCSQIFFHTYSRLPLYSCPTRAVLETLYLQVCYSLLPRYSCSRR